MKDYPYMVVPFDENEKKKAVAKGIQSTFCANIDIAIDVMTRQNKYSGVLWRIKLTENVFDKKVLVEFSRQELYILKQLVFNLIASDYYDSYTDDAKKVLNDIRNL